MTTSQFRLAPSSIVDALYESVRKRIINGDFSPGEKLTEQRIADEYDVARPTAKACLERLTALGLLRRSAHKTAVVPELSADDIRDLFTTRELLEGSAVGRLALLNHLPLEASRSQAAIVAAAESGDFAAQVQADILFHWALINGVDSPRLARVYELISGEIHLTMGQFQAHRTAQPTTVAAEHATIIEAIKKGQPDVATQALELHLRAARDRVLARRSTKATA
ncbi:MAG: GntR family transcriptional regulator [Propionibacteriaceae bacterium]